MGGDGCNMSKIVSAGLPGQTQAMICTLSGEGEEADARPGIGFKVIDACVVAVYGVPRGPKGE